jgi:hypothetical protein
MKNTVQNGKGDAPRNCFSGNYKNNFDNIKDFGYKPKWQLELEGALKKPKKKRIPKYTSSHWLNTDEYKKIQVIDPDGWDRENWEFSFYKEKITKEEFEKRLILSTIVKNS